MLRMMELKQLDLGHYERFLNVPLLKQMLLQEEFIFQLLKRKEFLGKTVQVVPHITNEIKENAMLGNSGDFDIVITEMETVGDIESLPI
jgi:CTP synthase